MSTFNKQAEQHSSGQDPKSVIDDVKENFLEMCRRIERQLLGNFKAYSNNARIGRMIFGEKERETMYSPVETLNIGRMYESVFFEVIKEKQDGRNVLELTQLYRTSLCEVLSGYQVDINTLINSGIVGQTSGIAQEDIKRLKEGGKCFLIETGIIEYEDKALFIASVALGKGDAGYDTLEALKKISDKMSGSNY